MTERLGTNSSGRQDYYSMMATVGFIRQENLLYKGCVNVTVTDGEKEKACNKKVSRFVFRSFLVFVCKK